MSVFMQIQSKFPQGKVYALQNGVQLLKISDFDGLAQVQQTIADAGYAVYDAWQESGSHFATYTKGEQALYLSFHEKTGTLRLVSDSSRAMAPQRAAGGEDQLAAPLLTQGRLMYYAYDCGMLYIIRLTDGRFVVIDGGMCEYEEPEHFLDLLHQQNVRGGKPEIAAWFITHPHDDHFNLFNHIMKYRGEEIQLDSLIYSWAEPEYAAPGSDLTDYNDAVENHCSGVKMIQPHTGQRFAYAGVTFNILYTHEDACPDYLENVNDTSIVMRMDIDELPGVGARRAMFFGDAMFGTAEFLCDQYAPEVLRSDLMQVAHHGYYGGSDRLYRTVDSKVILWPAPDYWFQTKQDLDCNRYLTQSPNLEALFIGGRHEVTLDLSQPIRPIDPYAAYDNARPGDVLYEENFTGSRIFDLNWSAINTGYTDYVSAALTLQKGSCRMVAGPHHSVCELMQPGMLRTAQNWTLTLRGHADCVGEAALFWNYADPSVYKEEEVLPLPLQSGEDFDIELIVDGDAGRARLKNQGRLIRELTFTPASRKGLYLILREADVTVTHIRVVKG